MNKRQRHNLLRTLPAIAALMAVILSPLAEANARPGFFGRVFGGDYRTMSCDPVTGVCSYQTVTPARPIIQRTRIRYSTYQGAATTSSSSTGGYGGYSCTGGSGAYVTVTEANPTADYKAMEDGSLLAQIMAHLQTDPQWTPGPGDDPLLHAAFDFLKAFSNVASTGALDSTPLGTANKGQPTVSLKGKISWVGPPSKTSLASMKLSWSPPTALLAAR